MTIIYVEEGATEERVDEGVTIEDALDFLDKRGIHLDHISFVVDDKDVAEFLALAWNFRKPSPIYEVEGRYRVVVYDEGWYP